MKKLSLMFAVLAAFNLRAEVVEIGSAADFAEKIAANPAGDYKLTANIDLTGSGYATIPEFSGTLDGNGKTISGLTVPLFGTVSGSAQIRNIVFDGANVANTTASTDSGILAVKMDGENFVVDSISFINCTIKKGGSGNAGMIAGTLTKSGTISNCSIANSCKMTASGNCGALGGFVGTATADGQNATIAFLNCVNFCTTLSRDYTAKYAGIICNATAKGSGGGADQRAHLVFADCTNYVGAVGKFTNPNYGAFAFSVNGGASSNMGDVLFERCANYGELGITGTKTAVGGFIVTGGNAQYTFIDCVNYADIKTVTAVPAGGFIGTLSALIKVPVTFKGCANLGDVSGNDAGGFIGSLAHNGSYGSNRVVFESCLQKGEITAVRETSVGAQLIGYLSSSVTYPYLGAKGSLLMDETLVGGNAGGSFGTEDFEDNVFADASEGLVDGTDLAALNAFGEGCNLWKQGSESPILKIMPDEPAPKVVTIRFLDAEVFGSTVLKTSVILKGTTPRAPEIPEHDGYTFLAWDPATFEGLEADTDIVATYVSGSLTHTVAFYDIHGDQIGETQEVEHGSPAVAPVPPVVDGKIFLRWDTDFESVTQDLSIHAIYTDAVVELDATADFAEVFDNVPDPHVVYKLTEDVTWPSDWTSRNFEATFDGQGHVISYTAKVPMFSDLYGTAANFILDGMNDETRTSITGINSTFGFLANQVIGGTVSGVTIRNFLSELSGSANYINDGGICGKAGNGALIENCTVESNVLIKTRLSYVGGIVGSVYMSDGWSVGEQGLTVLEIRGCTNRADICTFSSGDANLGGILAMADANDSSRRPLIRIVDCANFGNFTMTYTSGIGGHFGGIVAQRGANVSGQYGCLEIVDCANYGNLAQLGNGGAYGGALGYQYRLANVLIDGFQNHGTIGGETDPNGNVLTAGYAGGVIGQISELYNEQPVSVVNSANYGTVLGGIYTGGIVGSISANTGHGDTRIMVTNSANYVTFPASTDTHRYGQLFAAFQSITTASATRVYGAWNCFFMDDEFVGYNAGSVIHTEGNVTAVDVGYTSSSASVALNDWAKENGYEQWVDGNVGGIDYPELKIFCANPPTVKGLMLLFR